MVIPSPIVVLIPGVFHLCHWRWIGTIQKEAVVGSKYLEADEELGPAILVARQIVVSHGVLKIGVVDLTFGPGSGTAVDMVALLGWVAEDTNPIDLGLVPIHGDDGGMVEVIVTFISMAADEEWPKDAMQVWERRGAPFVSV